MFPNLTQVDAVPHSVRGPCKVSALKTLLVTTA